MSRLPIAILTVVTMGMWFHTVEATPLLHDATFELQQAEARLEQIELLKSGRWSHDDTDQHRLWHKVDQVTQSTRPEQDEKHEAQQWYRGRTPKHRDDDILCC